MQDSNVKAKFMWLKRCIHTCEGSYYSYWQRAGAAEITANRNNKQVIFKN